MAEVWKPIPDLAYEASSQGRIRNLSGHILTPFTTTSGYYRLGLADGTGRRPNFFVSRCVCAAFHGRPPTSTHLCGHLNGDTKDNRPENLAWITPAENMAHMHIHGTAMTGSKGSWSKLTEDQVADIRANCRPGGGSSGFKATAERLGVSSSTVSAIYWGQKWATFPGAHSHSEAA